MHRFKVGQKVVAIHNHSQHKFKKGDILTIEGLTCCSSCGNPLIILKELTAILITVCNSSQDFKGCGMETIGERERYNQRFFAPLQNNADAVEYRLKVSIPELTEIKELQNQ